MNATLVTHRGKERFGLGFELGRLRARPLCYVQALKPAIGRARFPEAFMRTDRFNRAFVEDDHQVGFANGGEAVSDDEARSAAGEPFHGHLDQPLTLVVEMASGLIEDQDGGIAHNCTCDADALALAAGQPEAALTHLCLIAEIAALDEIVGLGHAGRLLDIREQN